VATATAVFCLRQGGTFHFISFDFAAKSQNQMKTKVSSLAAADETRPLRRKQLRDRVIRGI
jgi:hypothetical protein